jgi:hypothetical protein
MNSDLRLRALRKRLEVVVEILGALGGLRYGSIVVTIQDSKVVQIEKNEKVRLQKKSGGEVLMPHLLFPANSSSFPCGHDSSCSAQL